MFLLNETQFYTTAELSKLLHVKEETVKGWRKRTKFDLPFYKIGGGVRYLGSDVIAWCVARRKEK